MGGLAVSSSVTQSVSRRGRRLMGGLAVSSSVTESVSRRGRRLMGGLAVSSSVTESVSRRGRRLMGGLAVSSSVTESVGRRGRRLMGGLAGHGVGPRNGEPLPQAVEATVVLHPGTGNMGSALVPAAIAVGRSSPGGDLASTWSARGGGCESRFPGGLVKHPGEQ
jgi:hypothetical protein